MVTQITSFGRSGLYDWMMQRVSAVVLSLYTVFIIGYLLLNPDQATGDQLKVYEAPNKRYMDFRHAFKVQTSSTTLH